MEFVNVESVTDCIYKATWEYSHKKWRDSLETRALYIEISLTSWNIPNGLKHWGSILRKIASCKVDQLLPGAFHDIMDKIEADILQIAKTWNWKWIFIHQGYFFRKISAINGSFGPKYLYFHGWSLKLGQNIKKFWQPKYWNVMQEQTQVNKSKDLCLKITDKLPKERLMYVNSNSTTLKFQRKRYYFRLWVLAFSSEWFYRWHWRVLPKVLQCK